MGEKMKQHLIKLLEDLILEVGRVDECQIEKADYTEVRTHLNAVAMSLIVNFKKEKKDEEI